MRLAFGGLTLDTDARQLLRGKEPVALSPKAFDLLAHLVESRPRALSKDELHERLWPATYVSETNLAGLIAEIRRAIQDDARTPRFVRTVHRFGYAFAGTIAEPPSGERQRAGSSGFWLVHGKRQIELIAGENILGREPDAGGFESTTVSRRHARVTVDGSTVFLEDLGSKNGTFLGGQRVGTKMPLADGDTIELGSIAVVFRAPSRDRSTQTWKKQRKR